jgi:hypothetical protein
MRECRETFRQEYVLAFHPELQHEVCVLDAQIVPFIRLIQTRA